MLTILVPALVTIMVLEIAVMHWLLLRPWFRAKRAYIREFTADGGWWSRSEPSPTALRRFKRIVRVLLFIQVGRIHYHGLENALVSGPRIIAANHGSAADVAIMLPFEEPLRALATSGLFSFGKGLGALLFGPLGAVPVDLTPGNGRPAFDSAVKLVAEGKPLLIFPEGWAYLDGEVRPFKKGAVRIAQQAAWLTGEPVNIIPTYMRYGRYPGKWILRFSPPVQYLFAFLLFFRYRRGLTVVFGKPISAHRLGIDVNRATEVLSESVLNSDPARRPICNCKSRLVI